MNISPEERKELNDLLLKLVERSSRSLVSLRKNDFENLSLDVEELAKSIGDFAVLAGGDGLPGV